MGIGEQERDPLKGRETLERREEVSGQFLTDECRLRRYRMRIRKIPNSPIRRGLQPFQGKPSHEAPPPLSIQRQVRGHPEQKRAEGSAWNVRGRCAVQTNERLLGEVLGFFPIGDKPIEEIQKRLLVSVQQPLERRCVSGPDLL